MTRRPARLALALILAALALAGCDNVYTSGGGYGGGWGGGGGLVIVHHSPTIIVHHYAPPVRVYTRRR
jgi:predicted small secreted protein